MTTEAPKDYATDYDVLDPDYIKNPFPAWDEIREQVPDRAHEPLGRLVDADEVRRSVQDRAGR